jgi:hypothetical protein
MPCAVYSALWNEVRFVSQLCRGPKATANLYLYSNATRLGINFVTVISNTVLVPFSAFSN